jgi:hypothetical protein
LQAVDSFADCSIVSPRVSTVTGAVLGQIWKEHSLNVHPIDSILQHQNRFGRHRRNKTLAAIHHLYYVRARTEEEIFSSEEAANGILICL